MTAVTAQSPRRSSPFMAIVRKAREANIVVLSVISLLIAGAFGAVLIILTTPTLLTSWESFFSHPGATIAASAKLVWWAYESLFQGAVVSFHDLSTWISNPTKANLATVLGPLSSTLTYASPLIVAGLGLSVGFRGSLFDIGGQGQVIAGAGAALIIGFSLHTSPFLQVPLEMVAAMVIGALLAGACGALKAYTGAHEVITTMMSSRIILALLPWFLGLGFIARAGFHDGASKTVNPQGQLPLLLGHLSPSLTLNLGFPIAIATVFLVQWFFNRSKTGFWIFMVGQSREAARTAGINIKQVTILTLALAGALLGMAGMLELTGIEQFMSTNFGGSYGIDAIAVALVGRNKPWGVFAAAVFFGMMQQGGQIMEATTGISQSLAIVIQAVVAFCIATPFFVCDIFKLRGVERLAALETSAGWA